MGSIKPFNNYIDYGIFENIYKKGTPIYREFQNRVKFKDMYIRGITCQLYNISYFKFPFVAYENNI